MGRFSQTIARLGAGYAVIGAVVWLLWPHDLAFVDNPEAWFILATSLIVWHSTEFKKSEETRAIGITSHDLYVATRLVNAHRGNLRYLLKDINLWSFVDVEIYREMRDMIDEWKRGELFFSRNRLQNQLSDFFGSLERLSNKVAQETVEEIISGKRVIGYKPFRIVSQEEYGRRMNRSEEADKIADTAWKLLDEIVTEIRTQIPDAYSNSLAQG